MDHPVTPSALAAKERRTGGAYGFSAYVLWGVFPLYWPLLVPATALEILAHRFAMSFVMLAAITTIRRGWTDFMTYMRRGHTRWLMIIPSLLVGVNWGVFIWAVNAGYVIEASLGYFINPVVSMVLGMVFFRERLRPLQWVAFSIAAFAIVVLTVDLGRPPWIGLVLALSFGMYGASKKAFQADSLNSLTLETAWLTPIAIGYIIWLEMQGEAAFLHEGALHASLMVLSGVVTAVPLLLFGAAATRVPLTVLGMLQYIGPTLQFLIGVYVVREPLEPSRLVGFAIVWFALAIFTVDALRHARQTVVARRADAVMP